MPRNAGGTGQSITVEIFLKRAVDINPDVIRLLRPEPGQSRTDFIQVKPGYFLIQFLRQNVDLVFITFPVLPELKLSQDLICKAVAHDKAGVSRGAAQIYQAAFGQKKDLMTVGKGKTIDLGFILRCSTPDSFHRAFTWISVSK
jgi:hypothetical protein